MEREKAEIGALISFQPPTSPMRKEAADAGFYSSPWGTSHPRLQLLTVDQLLHGGQLDYPPAAHVNVTTRKAPQASRSQGEQGTLDLAGAIGDTGHSAEEE